MALWPPAASVLLCGSLRNASEKAREARRSPEIQPHY
uniref:Uncharacterized protein n=1 Tax=Anguilla anguilla TaxID=7936 RepID=A0A0E9T5J4_ANGAN